MDKYIVHTAIKCSDGKTHKLSYDIVDEEITEGSAKAFGRIFTEIEKRFPDVQFWIQRYTEPEGEGLNDPSVVSIHEPAKYTDNEV